MPGVSDLVASLFDRLDPALAAAADPRRAAGMAAYISTSPATTSAGTFAWPDRACWPGYAR